MSVSWFQVTLISVDRSLAIRPDMQHVVFVWVGAAPCIRVDGHHTPETALATGTCLRNNIRESVKTSFRNTTAAYGHTIFLGRVRMVTGKLRHGVVMAAVDINRLVTGVGQSLAPKMRILHSKFVRRRYSTLRVHIMPTGHITPIKLRVRVSLL